MQIHEAHARIRAPVSEQALFDIFHGERLAQEGIAAQIDHAHAKIKAGPEVSIHAGHFLGAQRIALNGGPGWSEGAQKIHRLSLLSGSCRHHIENSPFRMASWADFWQAPGRSCV